MALLVGGRLGSRGRSARWRGLSSLRRQRRPPSPQDHPGTGI